MAFDIRSFKSNVSNRGFLRSHSYFVIVQPPLGGQEEIRLRTESVALPGAAFLTVDNYRPYSSGKIYNIPYSYNPQDIAMVHTVDSNGDLLKTYWNWINAVTDLRGDENFAANYHDDYIADQMVIFVYNESQEIIKTVTLFDVFPMSIDQMQMSWATTDETAKLSVNYRYSRYIIE